MFFTLCWNVHFVLASVSKSGFFFPPYEVLHFVTYHCMMVNWIWYDYYQNQTYILGITVKKKRNICKYGSGLFFINNVDLWFRPHQSIECIYTACFMNNNIHNTFSALMCNCNSRYCVELHLHCLGANHCTTKWKLILFYFYNYMHKLYNKCIYTCHGDLSSVCVCVCVRACLRACTWVGDFSRTQGNISGWPKPQPAGA